MDTGKEEDKGAPEKTWQVDAPTGKTVGVGKVSQVNQILRAQQEGSKKPKKRGSRPRPDPRLSVSVPPVSRIRNWSILDSSLFGDMYRRGELTNHRLSAHNPIIIRAEICNAGILPLE